MDILSFFTVQFSQKNVYKNLVSTIMKSTKKNYPIWYNRLYVMYFCRQTIDFFMNTDYNRKEKFKG